MNDKRNEQTRVCLPKFQIDELLAPLDDGRILHQGWSPRCEKEPSVSDSEWGVLKTTSIQPAAFLPEYNKRLPDHLEPRPQIEVKPGDILITCAGPRNRCGVACLVRVTRRRLMMSGKMYRFRPDPVRVDPRYLEAYLQSADAQAAIDEMKTGGNESGLNLTHDRFRKLLVPLAPLDQQKLIVAEIEKQFSRLDEAVANLKRVKANLKRYKAAVLKAAVEGRLVETEAELARREGRNYETGEQLLKRILETRRSQWQGKGKYKEPAAPDTTILPELPEGWCWITLETIAEVIDPNPSHRMPKYVLTGIPFISSENFIGEETIDFTIGKQVTMETLKQQKERFSIESGDFVLSRIGTIGKTRFLPVGKDYCLSHALVVIKVFSNLIHKEWLRRTISSDSILSQAREGIQSVGVPDLGMAKIRCFSVPLPPTGEQRRIAEEVDRRLSLLRETEAQVESNLQRAERLRQSILHQAFTGELN